MIQSVTLDDTAAIAVGAGILGTGGGGSTYLNRLRLENELRKQGGAVTIIRADDVPDDAVVCAVGGMGAPTVSNEKLQEGTEIKTAVRALGRSPAAESLRYRHWRDRRRQRLGSHDYGSAMWLACRRRRQHGTRLPRIANGYLHDLWIGARALCPG